MVAMSCSVKWVKAVWKNAPLHGRKAQDQKLNWPLVNGVMKLNRNYWNMLGNLRQNY